MSQARSFECGIPSIVDFRMQRDLVFDVNYLRFLHLSSADGTLLDLRQLVLDDASEIVDLFLALHKPITVHANEVEAMEAIVNFD